MGKISCSLLEPPVPLCYNYRLAYATSRRLGEDLLMAEVRTEHHPASAADSLLVAELAPDDVVAFHPAVLFDLFRVYKP